MSPAALRHAGKAATKANSVARRAAAVNLKT
jgi:hypothetical protein